MGASLEDGAGTGLSGNPSDNGATNAGAAYTFILRGPSWEPEAYLKASNTGAGDGFGEAVAMEGNSVLVGAPFEDGAGTGTAGDPQSDDAPGSGAAYAFLFPTPGFFAPYCFGDGTGSPCPCGNPGGPGQGCGNSTGFGATLQALGSSETGADDLVLALAGVAPDQPALLFMALHVVEGGAGLAFGDGLRCAWGAVIRLGVRMSGAQGAATWSRLGQAGGWQPGDVRRFQVWYRDPDFFGCAGFNLSNGLQVTYE